MTRSTVRFVLFAAFSSTVLFAAPPSGNDVSGHVYAISGAGFSRAKETATPVVHDSINISGDLSFAPDNSFTFTEMGGGTVYTGSWFPYTQSASAFFEASRELQYETIFAGNDFTVLQARFVKCVLGDNPSGIGGLYREKYRVRQVGGTRMKYKASGFFGGSQSS